MPSRRVVIDHITVGVRDLAASRRFYRAALGPLDFTEQGAWSAEEREVSFGVADHGDFAISTAYPSEGAVHVAFAADTPEDVDAFYDAAIAAGGTDNGPPGLRPEYSAAYYGAFVLDPDGHNVEAVCHLPRHA
jgi:catechol 2,3-dioxygenase-like lactoylglutathione lyase family enzyme